MDRLSQPLPDKLRQTFISSINNAKICQTKTKEEKQKKTCTFVTRKSILSRIYCKSEREIVEDEDVNYVEIL